MTRSPSLRQFVLGEVRRLFSDEAVLVVLVVLTASSVFVPPITSTPLKTVVGPLFVLFAPGYAFTLAVFPNDGGDPSEEQNGSLGLGTFERLVVSVGASIAIAGIVGIGLSRLQWGITTGSVFTTLSLATVCFLGIGGYRRRRLSAEERFTLPILLWSVRLLDSVKSGPAERRVLNLLLIVSVVASMGVVIHAIESPNDAETFTELHLLDSNGTDESIVADSADTLTVGTPENVTVGIESREFRRTNYTLVVALQRVSTQGNDTTVTEQTVLRRFEPTVAHNETWRRTHSVTPTMSGERLRLVYLLYRGNPPEQMTLANAYREVHLWVTVEPGEDNQTSSLETERRTIDLSSLTP